jgi:hypothetical protein
MATVFNWFGAFCLSYRLAVTDLPEASACADTDMFGASDGDPMPAHAAGANTRRR